MTKRAGRPGALLLCLLFTVLCNGQEPVVVRLRDAVGDTTDLAERDSFHLFPYTKDFRRAVILALPGPEFFAEIATGDSDSGRRLFLRVMPRDLERIRLLIDNRDEVAARMESDSKYTQSLASFWQEIEEHPLRNMAGEPLLEEGPPPRPPAPLISFRPRTYPEFHPVPPGLVPPPVPLVPPITTENRYNYTLHGATLGSIAGALFGSALGVSDVSSLVLAGVSSYVGYKHGERLDRAAAPVQPRQGAGIGWRTCCGAGCGISGVFVGVAAGAAVGAIGVASNGRFSWVSAVLTGACVTVEVATLGHHLGRTLDR